MRHFFLLLSLLLLALSGCSDLISVSDGGTVIVVVADVETQMGIGGVTATLHLRNGSGSEFERRGTTAANGEATFRIQEIGQLRVSVVPPPGYVEGATGLSEELVLNRGQTLTTVFLLVRER